MNDWNLHVERLCPATAASLGMIESDVREPCELVFLLTRAMDGLQQVASWHPLEQWRALSDFGCFLQNPSPEAGLRLRDRWKLALADRSPEAALLQQLPPLGAALQAQPASRRTRIQQLLGVSIARTQGFAMRSRADGTLALRDLNEVMEYLDVRAGIPAHLTVELILSLQPSLEPVRDKLVVQVSALGEGALLVRLVDGAHRAVEVNGSPFGDDISIRELEWLALVRLDQARAAAAGMRLGRVDRALAASLALFGSYLQATLDRIVWLSDAPAVEAAGTAWRSFRGAREAIRAFPLPPSRAYLRQFECADQCIGSIEGIGPLDAARGQFGDEEGARPGGRVRVRAPTAVDSGSTPPQGSPSDSCR